MYYIASQELRSKSHNLANIFLRDSSFGHQEYDLYNIHISATDSINASRWTKHFNMVINLLCPCSNVFSMKEHGCRRKEHTTGLIFL